MFIVGDLFDFYFEYPHTIPKMYFDLYLAIESLRKKDIEVHYVLGNHDYWVQSFIRDRLMTKVYPQAADIVIRGKSFHITHGDGILSWDRGYRILKAVIRNPFFIWCYRWLHPTLGYGFAHWVSRTGYHNGHSAEYNRRVQDELSAYASQQIARGSQFVICGHYHQSVDHELSGGKLIVMGDWISAPSYAYFDGNDLTLIPVDNHE